ncbi:MAG: VWA-like domain-containing protein [Bacteroidota bacterium]
MQQYLNEFESSLNPSVNWRRVLRIFSNSSSRTRIRNTLKRPSKRYGSNPGIKVRKKQKLLVAIDSSGSIKTEELQDFFNEVYHIWQQGAEIQIVECDVKIHQSYTYKGQNPSLVLGGGGTSFEAPIEYANLHFRPDALIYLTDGYGPKPGILSNCPILWLISREGAKLEYLQAFQGRKLKMN